MAVCGEPCVDHKYVENLAGRRLSRAAGPGSSPKNLSASGLGALRGCALQSSAWITAHPSPSSSTPGWRGFSLRQKSTRRARQPLLIRATHPVSNLSGDVRHYRRVTLFATGILRRSSSPKFSKEGHMPLRHSMSLAIKIRIAPARAEHTEHRRVHWPHTADAVVFHFQSTFIFPICKLLETWSGRRDSNARRRFGRPLVDGLPPHKLPNILVKNLENNYYA
jgi:hypothetical protein